MGNSKSKGAGAASRSEHMKDFVQSLFESVSTNDDGKIRKDQLKWLCDQNTLSALFKSGDLIDQEKFMGYFEKLSDDKLEKLANAAIQHSKGLFPGMENPFALMDWLNGSTWTTREYKSITITGEKVTLIIKTREDVAMEAKGVKRKSISSSNLSERSPRDLPPPKYGRLTATDLGKLDFQLQGTGSSAPHWHLVSSNGSDQLVWENWNTQKRQAWSLSSRHLRHYKPDLKIGNRVRLQGFKKTKILNNHLGKIVGNIDAKGRWPVELENFIDPGSGRKRTKPVPCLSQNLFKLYDFKSLADEKTSQHSFSFSIWLETLAPQVATDMRTLFQDEIPSKEELEALRRADVEYMQTLSKQSKERIWNAIETLKKNKFLLTGLCGET